MNSAWFGLIFGAIGTLACFLVIYALRVLVEDYLDRTGDLKRAAGWLSVGFILALLSTALMSAFSDVPSDTLLTNDTVGRLLAVVGCICLLIGLRFLLRYVQDMYRDR